MPSSIPDETRTIAERLVGQDGLTVIAVNGGGNNRLYRVETPDGHCFALKSYPSAREDTRDRLGTEFSALSFLTQNNITQTPQALAHDKENGFALYQWVDGQTIKSVQSHDIDQALDFVKTLHQARLYPAAATLPLASEACLSAQEILDQIARRRSRLAPIATTDAFLDAFFKDAFDHLLEQTEARARAGYQRAGWSFTEDIGTTKRTLSPSDFGFHNALAGPNGKIVFIDFEYFGWDDPVKLTADFLQHPGMSLDAQSLGQFKQGAKEIFTADDPTFSQRLSLLFPLIGLRWCLILLNEFLPQGWYRRQYAGSQEDRTIALTRQLDKAQYRITMIKDFLAGCGHDQ